MQRYGYTTRVVHDNNTGHGFVEVKLIPQDKGKVVLFDDAVAEAANARLEGLEEAARVLDTMKRELENAKVGKFILDVVELLTTKVRKRKDAKERKPHATN